MYREFFALDEYPFQLTSDDRYLFLGDGYTRTVDFLEYVLRIRSGVVVVTGEPGVGKTMMLEQVLAKLEANMVVGRIRQTRLTTTEFLLSMCLQFEITPARINKAILIDQIQRYCYRQYCEGKAVVLVVDEAHNLRLDTLEELRMLANWEINFKKLLQIVLVGQPALNYLLSADRDNSLSQMIHLSCQIVPLPMQEVENYIQYRLYVASSARMMGLIPSELMPGIMCYTGGVPRLINLLCDMILMVACMRRTHYIDSSCLHAAIKSLGWPVYQKRLTRLPKKPADDKFLQQRPLPVLERHHNGRIVARYLLNKERMLVGRGAGHDIQLDDRKVSRQHAQIICINGRYFLQDMNSTNGVFVNSRRINWHALCEHDRVRIGDCHFEFQEKTRDETPEHSSAPDLAEVS